MELKEDILSIIKKSLPELAAGELKNYIEESEKLKKDFEDGKKQYERVQKELQEEILLRKEAQNKLAKAETIIARENALIVSEKDFELKELKYEITKQLDVMQSKEAERRADTLFTLVGLLCKNSEAVKMFSGHETVCNNVSSFYDPNTGKSTNFPVETSRTITHVEKETKDKGIIPDPGIIG